VFLSTAAGGSHKMQSERATHSVSMSVRSDAPGAALEQVTIEYVPDETRDMFQIGRMTGGANDFVTPGALHTDAHGALAG
jgi:hypothetical protein